MLPSTSGLSGSLDFKPGSFFVGKADNLRLIARSSGDIRIVKEPTSGGGIDSAAIIFHSDGTLQASARKISLSTYNTAGAAQPYVRYSGLMKLLNEMIADYTSIASELNNFCTSLNKVAASLLTSISVPGTAGGPVAGAVTAGNELTKAITPFQLKVAEIIAKETAIKELIDADTPYDIQSSTIFGE